MNALARGIDGDNTTGPASIIASIVSTVVSGCSSTNYCSLGWVFLHKEQSAFKSTCDGAAIYFQNWKTLTKNSAKVIAITIVSLALIGGAFFGVAYLLLGSIEPLTAVLADIDAAATLEDGAPFPQDVADRAVRRHRADSVGRPPRRLREAYILVSVMRRYIEAGRTDTPQVDVYEKLFGMSKASKSPRPRAEQEGAASAA